MWEVLEVSGIFLFVIVRLPRRGTGDLVSAVTPGETKFSPREKYFLFGVLKVTSGVLLCALSVAFFYDAIEKILRRDGNFFHRIVVNFPSTPHFSYRCVVYALMKTLLESNASSIWHACLPNCNLLIIKGMKNGRCVRQKLSWILRAVTVKFTVCNYPSRMISASTC